MIDAHRWKGNEIKMKKWDQICMGQGKVRGGGGRILMKEIDSGRWWMAKTGRGLIGAEFDQLPSLWHPKISFFLSELLIFLNY